MSIIKIKKQKDYSMISNIFLRNSVLSWKAKGILTYLLSKPDDWEVYISQLASVSKDSKDSTRSGIDELIQAGYIQRTEKRLAGRFHYEYIIYEDKITENQDNCSEALPNQQTDRVGFSNAEKPTRKNRYGKSNATNINILNTDITTTTAAPASSDELSELINLIPPDVKKTSVINLVQKHLSERPVGAFDYIRDQIVYTNYTFYRKHSQNRNWISYKAYLGKSLDFGYGTGFFADSESRKQILENKKMALEEKAKKSDEERKNAEILEREAEEKMKSLQVKFDALSQERKTEFLNQFAETLNTFEKRRFLSGKNGDKNGISPMFKSRFFEFFEKNTEG